MAKSTFLIKAFLAGVIGSVALNFYWSINIDIVHTLVTNFQEYFGIVLVFWLVFGNYLRVKNWLLAGFVGSLFYSLVDTLVTQAISPVIGNPFESLGVASIYVLVPTIAGALGSFPQWWVSRNLFPKAYKWILANALGFGIFRFISWFHNYSYERDLFSFYQFVHNLSNVMVFENLLFIIQYGTFGVILGIVLFGFLKNKPELHSADTTN